MSSKDGDEADPLAALVRHQCQTAQGLMEGLKKSSETASKQVQDLLAQLRAGIQQDEAEVEEAKETLADVRTEILKRKYAADIGGLEEQLRIKRAQIAGLENELARVRRRLEQAQEENKLYRGWLTDTYKMTIRFFKSRFAAENLLLRMKQVAPCVQRPDKENIAGVELLLQEQYGKLQ